MLLGVAPFGDIYLAQGIPAELREKVLQAAKARYLAHPQVAVVFTPAELRRVPFPTGPADEWTLAERFRASFDPERSGDLIVAPKPHITALVDTRTYVATHGSPWNHDRKVPVLFYWPGIQGFEQPLPIETVDILPSLAALIELPVPPGRDRRPLHRARARCQREVRVGAALMTALSWQAMTRARAEAIFRAAQIASVASSDP